MGMCLFKLQVVLSVGCYDRGFNSKRQVQVRTACSGIYMNRICLCGHISTTQMNVIGDSGVRFESEHKNGISQTIYIYINIYIYMNFNIMLI
jgi:hypothetical protein